MAPFEYMKSKCGVWSFYLDLCNKQCLSPVKLPGSSCSICVQKAKKLLPVVIHRKKMLLPSEVSHVELRSRWNHPTIHENSMLHSVPFVLGPTLQSCAFCPLHSWPDLVKLQRAKGNYPDKKHAVDPHSTTDLERAVTIRPCSCPWISVWVAKLNCIVTTMVHVMNQFILLDNSKDRPQFVLLYPPSVSAAHLPLNSQKLIVCLRILMMKFFSSGDILISMTFADPAYPTLTQSGHLYYFYGVLHCYSHLVPCRECKTHCSSQTALSIALS